MTHEGIVTNFAGSPLFPWQLMEFFWASKKSRSRLVKAKSFSLLVYKRTFVFVPWFPQACQLLGGVFFFLSPFFPLILLLSTSDMSFWETPWNRSYTKKKSSTLKREKQSQLELCFVLKSFCRLGYFYWNGYTWLCATVSEKTCDFFLKFRITLRHFWLTPRLQK